MAIGGLIGTVIAGFSVVNSFRSNFESNKKVTEPVALKQQDARNNRSLAAEMLRP